MEQTVVILNYNGSNWDFAEAEEHATEVASDLGGFVDEAIEDTDTHEITVIIEDLSAAEIREGLKEVIGIANGISFRVEEEE